MNAVSWSIMVTLALGAVSWAAPTAAEPAPGRPAVDMPRPAPSNVGPMVRPGGAPVVQGELSWCRWLRQTAMIPAGELRTLGESAGLSPELLEGWRVVRERVGRDGTLWLVSIGREGPLDDADEGVRLGVSAQRAAHESYARILRQSELLAEMALVRQRRNVSSPSTRMIDACQQGGLGDARAPSSTGPADTALAPAPAAARGRQSEARRPLPTVEVTVDLRPSGHSPRPRWAAPAP